MSYSQLQHFILTCNCHLLQTFVVLLCTELSSNIFGHEATEEYLENIWHSLSLSHSLVSTVIFQKLFKQNQISCLFMWDGDTNYSPHWCCNFCLSHQSSCIELASIKPGMYLPWAALLKTAYVREKWEHAFGQTKGPNLEPEGLYLRTLSRSA